MGLKLAAEQNIDRQSDTMKAANRSALITVINYLLVY